MVKPSRSLAFKRGRSWMRAGSHPWKSTQGSGSAGLMLSLLHDLLDLCERGVFKSAQVRDAMKNGFYGGVRMRLNKSRHERLRTFQLHDAPSEKPLSFEHSILRPERHDLFSFHRQSLDRRVAIVHREDCCVGPARKNEVGVRKSGFVQIQSTLCSLSLELGGRR